MILYINIDDRARIIALADEGFHLGADEIVAEFADDLIQNGHVEIRDDRGIPKYKYVDGEAIERTPEEMDADYIPPEPDSSDGSTEERLAAIEGALMALQEGIDNV